MSISSKYFRCSYAFWIELYLVLFGAHFLAFIQQIDLRTNTAYEKTAKQKISEIDFHFNTCSLHVSMKHACLIDFIYWIGISNQFSKRRADIDEI